MSGLRGQRFAKARLASWSHTQGCGYLNLNGFGGDLTYIDLSTYDGLPSQIVAGETVICVTIDGQMYTWYMESDRWLPLDGSAEERQEPQTRLGHVKALKTQPVA